MKSLFACLLLGVSVILAVEGPSAAAAPEMPEVELRGRYMDPAPLYCCFDFAKRPVPLNLLKSFIYTNGRCSKSAVVFLTKKDREICADPSDQWVQDRIRDLSLS